MLPFVQLVLARQGFDAATKSSLQELTRMTILFLSRIVEQSTAICNSSGRTIVNLEDAILALESYDCTLNDLVLAQYDSTHPDSDVVVALDESETGLEGELKAIPAFEVYPSLLAETLNTISTNEVELHRPKYVPRYIPPFPPSHTYHHLEGRSKRSKITSSDLPNDPVVHSTHRHYKGRHLHPRIAALYTKIQARRAGEASLENLVHNIESRTSLSPVSASLSGDKAETSRLHAALGSVVHYRSNILGLPQVSEV